MAISKIRFLYIGLGEKCESIKAGGETIEIVRLAITDLSWRALSDYAETAGVTWICLRVFRR